MSLPQPTEDRPILEVAVVEPGLVAMTPAERSWAEVYERLFPRLCRSHARLLGGDVAHDVVQEALLEAWRKWPTLKPEERTDAYATHIVMRRVGDVLRRDERFQFVEYTRDLEEQGAVPVSRAHDADGTDDVAMIVDEVLSRMPAQRRAMCLLVYEHGLTIREAAAGLGIAYETARTHMKLAHIWLRKHMPVALHGYRLGRGPRELPPGDERGPAEGEESDE